MQFVDLLQTYIKFSSKFKSFQCTENGPAYIHGLQRMLLTFARLASIDTAVIK